MTEKLLDEVWYDELPDLQEIYDQATIYARTVGHIDWEFPMPEYILEDYWKKVRCIALEARL